MNISIERSDASGIMAFYADAELTPDSFAVLAAEALHTLGHLGLHHEVTLVDDGETLRGTIAIQDFVCTVKPERRLGKAGAVREGLKAALEHNPQAQYLIQSDFDGDPNPQQAQKLLKNLVQRDIKGNDPAMVLGERDEALKKGGYFDKHRQVVFALQKKFCTLLGYPNVLDPTTGLRVYTRKLAEIFVKHGKSTNFGSDVEQLVLAKLVGADILPVKLSSVRKRADQTAIFKFVDCQKALLLYEEVLKEEGLKELVDTFANIDLANNVKLDTPDGKFVLRSNGVVIKGSDIHR